MVPALALGQENPTSRLSTTNTRCSMTIGRWRSLLSPGGPTTSPGRWPLGPEASSPKVIKSVCDGFFGTTGYLAH